MLDYLVHRGYPLVLVTSGKLGSINHILLSLEVCAARGIRLYSLIYNQHPNNDPLITEETLRYFRLYLLQHHPNATLLVLPIIEM